MRKPRKTSPAKRTSSLIEILESRIAPASASVPILNAQWISANSGSANPSTGQATFELHAGQGLSSSGALSGTYFLYVEQGNAVVFCTDLNNDGVIESTEITGIAAGNGLRLISFVDIHGDIVTNLKEQQVIRPGPDGTVITRTALSLTDSDNNPTNDLEANGTYRGDGRVVLPNTIEKIELRALTTADIPDQNGDGTVNAADVSARQAIDSNFSIYGNIYAGGGFGAPDGGLIVNSDGAVTTFAHQVRPMVNAIKIGTATSGEYYSFGVSNRNDFQGVFVPFTPGKGVAGGSIDGVHTAGQKTTLNIGSLLAGDGGIGAAGGNVMNVTLSNDDTGGYVIRAGNGGAGGAGGNGGSILNFSDTGSVTSRVLIKSGDGGTGSNGPGGASGNAAFGTLNLRGDVSVQLGNGGNGFTAGGNGASLAGGLVTTPDPLDPYGLSALGVTNLADTSSGVYTPRIGIQQGIDFNGDGFGDIVFTTGTPSTSADNSSVPSRSQLFIMLGTDPYGPNAGGWQTIQDVNSDSTSRAIFLPGLRNADAITVADFNGDGHPDIAVASSDHGQAAGIVVYLAKFVDKNHDGIMTPDEFVGFTDGRFSPVTLPNPVQINKLAAGDFGGVDPATGLDTVVADGHVELAVLMTYENPPALQPPQYVQVLGFMQQDYENGKQTGQFYFDLGRNADPTAQPPISAISRDPLIPLYNGDGDTVDIKATALADGTNGSIASTRDIVLVSQRDSAKPILAVDYSARSIGGFPITPQIIGAYALGTVDTDRAFDVPGQVGPPPVAPVSHTKLVGMTSHDFTVVDLNRDGIADVGVISATATGPFFVGVLGDGTGSGTQASGSGKDNAGNFILPGASEDPLKAITSGDFNQDGSPNEIGIASTAPGIGDYDSHYVWGPGIDGIQPAPFPSFGVTSIDFDDLKANPSIPYTTYVVLVNDLSTSTSAAGVAKDQKLGAVTYLGGIDFPVGAVIPGLPFPLVKQSIAYTSDEFIYNAGNGGFSLTGNGGSGGSFGGKLNGDPAKADLRFVVSSVNPVALHAGKGGDGFFNGGTGGKVTGVSVKQTQAYTVWDSVQFFGGDGGRGVSGTGGAGGDLSDNFADNGLTFIAGNGGVGRTGGQGGNVIGSGLRGNFDSTAGGDGGVPINGYYDTAYYGTLFVQAGAGGAGNRAGGHGGGILNFAPAPFSVPGVPDQLIYIGGDGGVASSGPGGAGGSVAHSSPLVQNFLDDDILVQTGKGGTGLSGGAGGAIVDFVDLADKAVNRVKLVSFLTGDGGNATAGTGGSGGAISGVTVPTTGLSHLGQLTPWNFDRMIAGNGGDSSSGTGGNGGGIDTVFSTAQQASYAVVAGAGGNGLYFGGNGGSLVSVEVAVGAGPFSQALLIAGAGGDGSAFTPNAHDTAPDQAKKAFGGIVGKGGNGGSIIGVTQSGASQSHTNLIAGNGGDTIFFGTVYDSIAVGKGVKALKPSAGAGGSIFNAVVAGDLGNMTADDPAIAGQQAVPIKSYNDILNGETMAAWVQAKFLDPTGPRGFDLTDLDGNVGVVVGAAGRNKAVVLDPVNHPGVYRSQPSSGTLNGSLINLVARNLMSAVAGSVDRIAAINVAQNIQVPPGVIGALKGEFGAVPPTPAYLDQDGVPTTDKTGDVTKGDPVLEGRLIDGALVAKKILGADGLAVTLPGRVFPFPQ